LSKEKMLYRPSLEKHFSLRQAAVTLCDSFEKQKVKRKLPILLNQIMEIFKSTNYFLKDFKEIFSTGILGKEGGFEKFLNDKKILEKIGMKTIHKLIGKKLKNIINFSLIMLTMKLKLAIG
jgi:hypothetical protein